MTRFKRPRAEKKKRRARAASVSSESGGESGAAGEGPRSTNDALEGSKGERRALTEKLVAVTNQLEGKVQQLQATNDDLRNLLSSTEIATIFLGLDLRIRVLTPGTRGFLNVIESDVGRPISDLATRWNDPHLLADARAVLDDFQPREREVGVADGRTFRRRVLPYRAGNDRIDGVVVTIDDVTALETALKRGETRERQQALVAELGRNALCMTSIQELLDQAVDRVSVGLDVEFAKLLELTSDGDELLLRSGIGWKPGLVGTTRLSVASNSQAGFTLRSNAPVVVEDLAEEHRFGGPALLLEHEVSSGMSVIVGTLDHPWGVLGAHTATRRSFSVDDIHFLEAIANVIADAITRAEFEEELRRRAHEMSLLFRATTSASKSLDEALQSSIDAVCEITGWPVGHAFVRAPNGRTMNSSRIWHTDDPARTAELRARSEQSSFDRGVGFVGTIWRRRRPVGIEDMSRDLASADARLRGSFDIRGAFGFPVIVSGEVAAILEFFSEEPIRKETLPLDIVRTLGDQVGRVYERNRHAQSLLESAQRLSLALEAGGLATWDWDMESDATTWNEEHYRMLGHEPGSVTPGWEAWHERLHPDDRDRVIATYHDARLQRTSYRCEYRIVRPNGDVVWVEARGRFSYDAGGAPHRLYGVIMDVTERREMEERLVEADRRKDTFLTTLGHELRNPLAALVNGIRVVRTRDKGEDVGEVCSMMARQARQMTRLLDDLLDVGRILRGNVELHPRRVDLAEAIERAVETVRGEITEQGHEVSISTMPADVSVVADPIRLEQILINLLSNATRYATGPGKITIQGHATSGGVRLSVRDTGIGLTEQEKYDIFEPFFQARKGSGGLGIGLNVVRDLMELHGGGVEVQSDGPGRGSTFILTFPDGVPPVIETFEPADDLANVDLSRLRVLAVDDHADSLTVLRVLLSDQCEVATASTGAAAVETARRFRPHVILLDLSLPDMSGFEVAAKLDDNVELRDTYRVALTGFGDPETEVQVQKAGFSKHLLKPIDFDALLRLLQQIARKLAA